MKEPGSQIGTSRQSANYAALGTLVAWGLATEVPLEIDLPPELLDALVSVAIHDDAKPEIEALLDAARPRAAEPD